MKKSIIIMKNRHSYANKTVYDDLIKFIMAFYVLVKIIINDVI
jgi:hypothetical protein